MANILERPLITITNIIWSFNQATQQIQVLLVKRAHDPFKNNWALPETFMRANESADHAALRLIKEKIGLTLAEFHTEQLATFTNQHRTTGERALSLAYMTFLPEMTPLQAGYGALDVRWFAFTPLEAAYQLSNQDCLFQTTTTTADEYYQDLPQTPSDQQLAFDHQWILTVACQRILNKLDYQPNILMILGPSFTLREARTIYAAFRKTSLTAIDNSNFKKTHQHLFLEAGTTSQLRVGRPARLYRLKPQN
ncbi:NUDIX domain-containing protein [Lapidilactobacillus gannanensis]|jgi:ADP-ribose pyrophosphatase YjhB (NUDIX family)|uniref:NUDIX domain-containing protein n=1 Tax=Lapidilactobacillus gannanensis TaxID=2486002 RepID=A0ABW4BKW9_9LACO|nr:NUDIX domain-containing protein [Lapidilactobacillus gannanensis]MCH4057316.1 NUDIX domain-containing protein [Lactobacillaceae bacterium]